MNAPRFGRTAIALLAGALVTFAVWQSSLERVRGEEGVEVIVAARDIPARTVLTADALRTVSLPRSAVPAGSLTSVDAAEKRILRDPLYAGELVNERHLAQRGSDLSASLLIPSGKPYAFNLPVSMFIAAPPRLQVHDRIDVVAYPRGKPISEGGVIVPNLEIIDLSPRATDNASETLFLTVGATSDEIVRILAAREGFTLAIALRPFTRPESP
jgi:Flp pilus assembly protein CpaB